MAWCRIREDLWGSFSHLPERVDLVKDAADLRRVDEVLLACSTCCECDLVDCVLLNRELRAEYGVDAWIEELLRSCSSVSGGTVDRTLSQCVTRENLLWDRLEIQCKLLVKSGLAGRPTDCVEVL